MNSTMINGWHMKFVLISQTIIDKLNQDVITKNFFQNLVDDFERVLPSR